MTKRDAQSARAMELAAKLHTSGDYCIHMTGNVCKSCFIGSRTALIDTALREAEARGKVAGAREAWRRSIDNALNAPSQSSYDRDFRRLAMREWLVEVRDAHLAELAHHHGDDDAEMD